MWNKFNSSAALDFEAFPLNVRVIFEANTLMSIFYWFNQRNTAKNSIKFRKYLQLMHIYFKKLASDCFF